jgi:hypothetical protein
MPSYDDLVELARICLRQARQTASPAVADGKWPGTISGARPC